MTTLGLKDRNIGSFDVKLKPCQRPSDGFRCKRSNPILGTDRFQEPRPV